jgi:hypothetical protein
MLLSVFKLIALHSEYRLSQIYDIFFILPLTIQNLSFSCVKPLHSWRGGGQVVDSNTILKDGFLELHNVKETIEGTDPQGTFKYTNAMVNTLGKVKITDVNLI